MIRRHIERPSSTALVCGNHSTAVPVVHPFDSPMLATCLHCLDGLAAYHARQAEAMRKRAARVRRDRVEVTELLFPAGVLREMVAEPGTSDESESLTEKVARMMQEHHAENQKALDRLAFNDWTAEEPRYANPLIVTPNDVLTAQETS